MENTQKKVGSFTLHGIGRRKKAVARVWLKRGNGTITINGKAHELYFDAPLARTAVLTPFKIANCEKSFDAKINVTGGGKTGQSEAIRLGIARALLISDESLRPTLKKNDLLSVDSRVKERKKYGQKAARKKFQFVKR